MTDTPGWAPPGSPEPHRDDQRPPAGEQTDPGGAAGGTGPYDGGYGGAYGSIPSQGQGPDGPGGPAWGGGAPGGWGTPPPGPGGWGAPGAGPGGWGQVGWAPVSPKPGIIPLRPLGVGEVLDGAVTTVRKHWRTALGLSFTLAAVEQLVQALADWWAYQSPGRSSDVLSLAVGMPLNLLLGVVAVGMLTMVVSKAVLGHPTDLRDAWTAARPRLLALTGVTLLSGLIVAAPLIPGIVLVVLGLVGVTDHALLGLGLLLGLAGSPFALWLGVRLSLAAPALVLERQGVIASLRRSTRLVRNAWWRLFGIKLLTQLLITLASGMIAAPFVMIALAVAGPTDAGPADPFAAAALPPLGLLIVAIAGTLVATFTIPLAATVNVLLYIDQRIRREALDIELARAAGLPEYGTAPAGQPAPGA
ncbi:hypothetical protein [Kitasatospora sp. NPDC059571]|uniref:DUF7847 domain-containing protein n=1 Tax=Kitasatospora sp. NPDC059571 TaxID=3346871 RepID=UPI0036A7096B